MIEKNIQKRLNGIYNKIPLLIEEMNNKFLEREDEISMLILALFSKRHIFFIGEPGVGKTDVFNTFATCIEDGKFYDVCIKEDTTYEEIFGEYYRNKEGKRIYDFENSIVKSHLAFIDEIWKGNSKTMNSLLSIASGNRVAYIQGYGKVYSPILMIGAASNEMPEDESLNALSDRFVIKMRVDRIRNDENWKKFITKQYDQKRYVETKFSPEDVEFFNDFALKNSHISENFVDLYADMKRKALKIKLPMSDRRLGYSMDIILVSAVLNIRIEVDYSDFFILLYTMWSEEHEIKEVKKIIFETLFGITSEIEQVYNNVVKRYEYLLAYKKDTLDFFLNHRSEISGDKQHIYRNQYNMTLQYHEALVALFENGIEYILNDFRRHRFVEKQIENNYLIKNYKSNVYSEFDIFPVVKLRYKLRKELKYINRWIAENNTLFLYNSHCEISS